MKKSLPLAAVLTVAFSSVSNAATVVYAEAFSRTDGGAGALSTANWIGYRQGGVAVTTSNAFLSNQNGNPNNLSNTGQTQTSAQTIQGVAVVGSSSGNAFLGYTTEYNGATPLTRSNLSTISLRNVNNGYDDGGAPIYRVALQIGGSWYASTSMDGTPGFGTATQFPSNATEQTLSNFTASNWTTINFTVDSVLSLGTPGQALPTGTVSAFGVYIERPDTNPGTSRFDSFVVSIPEPSGAMLLGASGFLILLRRRR